MKIYSIDTTDKSVDEEDDDTNERVLNGLMNVNDILRLEFFQLLRLLNDTQLGGFYDF